MAELLAADEIALVREHLQDAPAWYDLSQRLETSTDEVGPLRWLSLGFVYHLNTFGGREEKDHGPYDVAVTSEFSYPPFPADVETPVRDVWRQACGELNDPIVLSRLHDLAYVADGRSAHADGRKAAKALVELAQLETWDVLDRAQCMARAIDISLELNDTDACVRYGEAAAALANELLKQEHPGPPFFVLRSILSLKPEHHPAELDALIQETIDRFSGSSHHVGALDLAIAATTDSKRKAQLRREQLNVMTREADEAKGLAQVDRIRRAAQFAERHNLRQEANDLLSRLQEMSSTDLELEPFTTETEVPTELVQATIDEHAGSGAADIRDALIRIGHYGPPGGSIDDLNETVEEIRKGHPLLDLFPTTLFREGSAVPTFIADGPESKKRLALGQQRQLAAHFNASLLLGPMLLQAKEHHGRPAHDELTAIWSTELIGPERADRIARAVELFWDEHYDDAAHVLVPRLESILRDAARHSGILIHKQPAPGRYGGVISLNAVLDKLVQLSDREPWHCYLRDLLCEPLALNLRNEIAHGLHTKARPIDAALLVHAACFLLRLKITRHEAETPDAPKPDNDETDAEDPS